MRLGIFADSHVSVRRVEQISWHNPFRLPDSAKRLERALAHPLLEQAEVLVGLGDLVHFGEEESLTAVIEMVAARGLPAVLISGNHDVIQDEVRVHDSIERVGAKSIATPLRPAPGPITEAWHNAGLGLVVHEVTGIWPSSDQPFGVVERELVPGAGAPSLVLSHFPVLSLRDQAEAADFLYAGHLSDLARPPEMEWTSRPAIVLSGHIHMRGVTAAEHILQIAFAALVEDPFDVALVEIERKGAEVHLAYECQSVDEPVADRQPVLASPRGSWRYQSGTWHTE